MQGNLWEDRAGKRFLALQKRPKEEIVAFLPLAFCVKGVMLIGVAAIFRTVR